MKEVKVISITNFKDEEIPAIENGFGKDKRAILVKSIAELYGLTVTYLNKIICDNITEFKENVDIIDIKQILLNNEVLMRSLNLTKREVGGTTKYVYILSEQGYLKLMQRLNTKKISTSVVMDKFIEQYFFKEKYYEKCLKRTLDESGINRIFEAAKKNKYLKEIERALRTPQGTKGVIFKNKEVQEFKSKVNKDMELFLLKKLGVESINDIPAFVLDLSMELMEKCYTLSDDLKHEFINLMNKLTDLRFEVIEENRKRNNKIFQTLNIRVQEFKELYRMALK